MKFTLMPKEINHKGLFMFGVIFYFFVPLIIIQTDIFDGLPGIEGWKTNRLNRSDSIEYLLLVFELILLFYIGSQLAYTYSNPHWSTKRELGKLSSKILTFITTLFVLYLLYTIRLSAFSGRDALGGLDDRIEGILSTTGLLVFYLHFAIKQPKSSKRIFLILFIITAVSLLGLGGRMYVIIPLVAYYMRAYNNAVTRGKSRLPYLIVPLVVAISASIIGAIRIGEKLDKIAYFIFAEPIFTSYSSFSYINKNVVNWFQMPKNFFVSLLNFIPSLVWPNKAQLLVGLSGTWAKFDNPLGALSVFTTIYGDFGIIFGGIFIFSLGAFFGVLYKAFKTNNMNKNLYYCYCAVLPFCFFRDPIGIPLKIFITSFGIIPFVIQLFKQSLNKKA